MIGPKGPSPETDAYAHLVRVAVVSGSHDDKAPLGLYITGGGLGGYGESFGVESGCIALLIGGQGGF